MATTGLEVFDRTLHTTNLWLDEINAEIGPDRHLAWHVLGAVLRSIRDEMQVEQSAHFAAQLPLLIRGAYFDQYRPATQPAQARSQEDFIARIQHEMDGSRPVNVLQAAAAVMRTLNRHVTEGQVKKVRDSLPKGVRAMWPEPGHEPEHRGPPHRSEQTSDQRAKSDRGADRGAKSDQGTKSAEPARSAGQRMQPPSEQHAAASLQQAAPQRPAAPPGTPPQQASLQRAAPQPAAPPSPAPQHAAPQSSQHPASKRPAREWEEIEQVEIIEEEEGPSMAGSSSSRSAHVPIGAASRPESVHAAPAGGRTTTTRKKTPAKRKDD